MTSAVALDPVLRLAEPRAVRAPVLPARLPDWPERLAEYIDRKRRQPFAWGANDCATFAAGAVSAITGARLADLLPGVWGNVHEADRLMRDMAGLQAGAIRMLGEPVRGDLARHAPRGSVVCVEIEGRATLGMLASGSAWCAPGEHGLVFRPAGEVRMAWGV